MSFASGFNRGSKFEVKTEGMQYVKIKELTVNRVYPLDAIYCRKGKFGREAVFVDCADGICVNIPGHMMGVIDDVLADDAAVDDIKSGRVGFKMRTFKAQNYGTTGYAVDFVDM